MRAVQISRCGGTEVLELVHVPVPARKAGQVLVKTQSVGVNPVDLIVREGYYKPEAFPKILGGDVVGYVEEADEGSQFKKGDKVFCLTPGYLNATQEGTYAEFVAADEAWLARVPDNLALEEAAGVPLVALTAWQALQSAKPQAGQRCLVNAAAGGVGHMAVQLAKALGLHVTAVCGPANVEWVKGLGADEVIDYSTQDVADVLKGRPVDIAVDCMGTRSKLLQRMLGLVQPSGTLAHILNAGTDNEVLDAAKAAHAEGKGPAVATILVQPNGAQLQQVADLIAAGKVRLEVALSVPLAEVARAHDQVATGHTRGKVVLTV